MTMSVAPWNPAVETHGEKPDEADWLVEPDVPGPPEGGQPPVGPPLGVSFRQCDVARTVRYGPRVAPPMDEPLRVVSGYLDDRRKMVGPGDSDYAGAAYAYAHRDYWTDDEHREYWGAHLHLWPSRAGRPSDIESSAFTIVHAETLGVSLDELLPRMFWKRSDLRDRHILDMADHMRLELEAGPSSMRVPRVVTDAELDQMPHLTARQTLDATEGAANVNFSRLGADVIRRGCRAVSAELG